MDEKILIKSEQYNITKLLKRFIYVGAALSVLMYVFLVIDGMSLYDTYLEHQQKSRCAYFYDYWTKCYACRDIADGLSKIGYGIAITNRDNVFYCLLPLMIISLIGVLIYFWLHSYELTVTDKRIYGKVAWGKRVDLPIDSVSATATITVFRGVSVSTSSGRISFLVMKNASEIYRIINNLLIERQSKPVTNTIKTEVSQSNADELKKYKELLDMGVITQEEFDQKKSQLLGL